MMAMSITSSMLDILILLVHCLIIPETLPSDMPTMIAIWLLVLPFAALYH
jgi:hypothetical protein